MTAGSAQRFWAALVGRAALWCLTALMASCTLAVPVSVAWLSGVFDDAPWFAPLHRASVLAVLLSGSALFVVLFVLQRRLVPARDSDYRSLAQARVHVALTAYNDEVCIGQAVQDFKANPAVDRVIVVENNSRDRTADAARQGGADEVVTELEPGYGSCCMRALLEASRGLDDDDVVVLCEGDLTFSGRDVQKFVSYLENCDLVLGTRATQELRDSQTQMDWLINPFNQLVAKMIQTRFWGTRLTDVGCTYRAMRAGAYRRLTPHLRVRGNHFSPHMYMEALKLHLRVIEVPVVFRDRAGQSKGVGSDKIKAARVALRMLGLLYRA